MARFLRQVGACTGGRKGADLSDCKARSRGRRERQIGRTGSRSNPTPALVLTKRSKHPGGTAAGALRGAPETRAALADAIQRSGPGLQTDPPRCGGDMGCSSLVSRRGARNNRERASARSRPVPCPSLGGARPMLLGEAIPRAPSLTEATRHRTRRPRLERGDAPARGTRRGWSEGMAPWRHLTDRVKSPGVSSPTVLATRRDGGARVRWKHRARVKRADGSLFL